MHDTRPDPDILPARVQKEETPQGRRKLKIFFGATATASAPPPVTKEC